MAMVAEHVSKFNFLLSTNEGSISFDYTLYIQC